VMVLLTGVIYQVRNWDGLRWHDIQYEPSSMKTGSVIRIVLKLLPRKVRCFGVGTTNDRNFFAVEIVSAGITDHVYTPFQSVLK
jgi:hypothetical protein